MDDVDQELWGQMWQRLTEIEGITDITIIEIQPDKVVYAPGNRSGWWGRPWKRDEDGKLWLWTRATREQS